VPTASIATHVAASLPDRTNRIIMTFCIPSMCPRLRLRARAAPIAMVLLVTIASSADAQIRGRPVADPDAGWWFSGGASAAVLNDINDGASGSTWRFGSDPLLQLRGSLEKALDDATTIGVSAAFGRVDLTVVPFVIPEGSPLANPASPLPASCLQGCTAETEMWSAMVQFRSGGGDRFHTFFEANGGVTGFRNMRTRAGREAIGKSSMDLSGTLGGGFGYTLSNGFAITVVQDFGIGFHSKSGLPEGVSRSWRIRNTRAALRFKF
jgi:hypothetical protein